VTRADQRWPAVPRAHPSAVTPARDGDGGYAVTAEHMFSLAAEQPGILGVDSVREGPDLGITVSYWREEESIAAWRQHAEHTIARDTGRERWYEAFEVHVAKVERRYAFTRPDTR
jgi:heme-degrading monooxygenase HmoA